MKRLLKTLWMFLKFVAVVVAVLVALAAFVRVADMPGVKRFNRYCSHPSLDALLAVEANDVVRFDACTIRGTNLTIVLMKPCRWLASGGAMFVYDARGRLVDKTRDEGDDGRFQRMWGDAWRKSLSESTHRWLRETRMPETNCFAPATMADFAAHLEQASKDYDRSDMPKDKRGVRFKCCTNAAKVVFPEKPQGDQSPIETLPGGDVSFWDALTNACERTGCSYRIYGGEVSICNCK